MSGAGLAIYSAPLLVIWALYLGHRHKVERRNIATRDAAVAAGLTEPASLHPVVDPKLCIGCGSCTAACPEHGILGLIRGKAQLVNPTKCIGHGACKTSCPVGAITLVFGTERRGVDIPIVGPDFQADVPGIFIAGELGGMGLIRNAIEQGRQAIDAIRKLAGIGQPDMLDVVIVGAGPAGFSSTLAAMEHGLRAVTVEQDSLGGTVSHYPRGKLVMTAPAKLPLYGKVKFTETDKEALLDFWHEVEAKTGARVNYKERVEAIRKIDRGFEVQTSRESYVTRAVLLAIGRRGTPRKLDVPGENLAKVVYRLIDPAQYQGQEVLVVGGGDSALEVAISIAEEADTTVTISYRGDAFSRTKEKNRQKIADAEAAGRLRVLLRSNVVKIDEGAVEIDHDGTPLRLPNDAVIVCAGGILPTAFLKSIGITVETKYGTA